MQKIHKKKVSIFGLLRNQFGLLTLGSIALAIGSAVNLIIPEVLRRIINREDLSYISHNAWELALLFIAMFALQGASFYFRSYIFAVLGHRAVADLRRNLFANIIRQEIPFFDKRRTGDLVSRINADTQMVQDAISVKLSIFIRYSFQVLAGIVLMCLLSIQLTIAILLALPILIGISMLLGSQLRKISKAQQQKLGVATDIAEETLSAAKIVKAFNREAWEENRFTTAVNQVLELAIKRSSIAAFFSSFVSFLMNVAIASITIYGLLLVADGRLSSGDLAAFMMYGLIVAVSFAFVAGGYADFQQALGAAERVFELTQKEVKPLLSASTTSDFIKAKASPDIILQNISFSYPSRPESTVLQNLDLVIPGKQVTALVGPSGAGKSTIVSMLLRFYEPDAGKILFGDRLLTQIDPPTLRDMIAIVPQDAMLFAVSIADNLRYGKPDATIEELEDVCQRVNLLEWIRSLPQGFETNAGQTGSLISGGQRQRLAIARAMLRDPALLILDEATSSLDSENEFYIQQALSALMKGRTTLIIAHRLATVQGADKLVVMNHGKIVQEGTHASLAQQPGLYQTMVQRQELVSAAVNQ